MVSWVLHLGLRFGPQTLLLRFLLAFAWAESLVLQVVQAQVVVLGRQYSLLHFLLGRFAQHVGGASLCQWAPSRLVPFRWNSTIMAGTLSTQCGDKSHHP